MYIIGIDLGQAKDYTAIAILRKLERDEGAIYHVQHLERLPLGISYPDIVTRVQEIKAKIEEANLVVDQTGVGAPVVDLLQKAGLGPIGIKIHGGANTTHDDSTWSVPKRDLVSTLQILLQSKQLKVARGPLSNILIEEMLKFRFKIDPVTAHDSYSAWREQDHDDLVLAVALGVWYGENAMPGPVFIPDDFGEPDGVDWAEIDDMSYSSAY